MQNINHLVEMKHLVVKNNFGVIDTHELKHKKYQGIL